MLDKEMISGFSLGFTTKWRFDPKRKQSIKRKGTLFVEKIGWIITVCGQCNQ
jgi:heterodisulfide reductase subunit B